MARNLLIKGKVTATAGITKTSGLALTESGIRRLTLIRELRKKSKFDIIWYTVFITMLVASDILLLTMGKFNLSFVLATLDVVLYMISSNLTAKGKVAGLYLNSVECLVYVGLCMTSALYGEIIKVLIVSLPLKIASIISWTKNKKNAKNNKYAKGQEIIIRKMNWKNWLLVVISLVFGTIIMYFVLGALGTNKLLLSSLTFTMGIIVSILSAMCYKEHWYLLIVSTLISTILWMTIIFGGDLGSLPILTSYFSSLVNSVYGVIMWTAMYRKVAVNGAQSLAMRKIKISHVKKLRKQLKGLKLTWNKETDIKNEESRNQLLKISDISKV
ncbi:MAG: nicotinamide riboside transporter PnuC [Clostridia bacterium]